MQRDPIRLGSSTSGLTRAFSEEVKELLQRVSNLSEEESDALRAAMCNYGRQIEGSGIRSLEYFLSAASLDLGLANPMMDMLRDTGQSCEIWSVHAPFGGVDLASPDEQMRLESIGKVARAADIAKELGAGVMTVHPALELKDMEHMRQERIELSGRSIAQVSDYCADLGIRVAVEILPRSCIGNSFDELAAILDAADRADAGFCLDTNHSFPASALTDVVRRMGPRLVTLHVSDHDDVDERHWLPGKGLIDWPAFIRALGEVGYDGPFVYEVPLPYPEFSEAISALEHNYRTLMTSV